MEWLIEGPWRMYPAALLMAAGAGLALAGGRRAIIGMVRPIKEPGKALSIYRGFRRMVIGLAVLGIGVAWAWHLEWVLALSLIIGAGEVFESSLDIWALTKGKNLRLTYPPRR
jgi:hypothetical protein